MADLSSMGLDWSLLSMATSTHSHATMVTDSIVANQMANLKYIAGQTNLEL